MRFYLLKILQIALITVTLEKNSVVRGRLSNLDVELAKKCNQKRLARLKNMFFPQEMQSIIPVKFLLANFEGLLAILTSLLANLTYLLEN
jgi:hypothetical protein